MNKLFLSLAFLFYALTVKCGNIPQAHLCRLAAPQKVDTEWWKNN